MDKKVNFKSEFCNGYIREINRHDIVIKGKIDESVKDNKIFFIAASPADYRATFTGSGLPFYNQIQAFENTPNIGVVDLHNNSFEIKLLTPNSYMVGLGSVTVPPTVYIEYIDIHNKTKNISVKVSNGIPYRSLTWPLVPRARDGADFYDSQFYLPVRTQEQILLDSGYPKVNIMPPNHFGMKPPL